MLMTVLKVLYVVIAILMTAFILLQRGAGAQQGGGFGAGASATVFGASGSANFLSKSTKWLAMLFFGLSIAMAAIIAHSSRGPVGPAALDAGVMSNFSETPELVAPPVAAPLSSEVPSVGADSSAAPVAEPVDAAAAEAVAPAPEADKQEDKSDN